MKVSPTARPSGSVAATTAGESFPHPRPRFVGFSPRVVVSTTDKGLPLGNLDNLEHELEPVYSGTPLNPPASTNYVVGFLDSGADVNLAAGSSAVRLGLTGANLTQSIVPIGGVGGTLDALITMPIGYFAAGLGAIDMFGELNTATVVGHSNVCGLAAPPIDCGGGEVVTAVMGLPFLSFYNSIIRVDTPRRVSVNGVIHLSPEVTIQDVLAPLPTFTEHVISMSFGSFFGPLVTTANYFVDFEDLETPIIPTLLSFIPGSLPTGGAFFSTARLRHGPASSDNPAEPFRFLVDTGAQGSIISRQTVADLSLPLTPDFTVTVCGVGGLTEGVPGYYVDYVRINAAGGALEFSRAPFVVLDLPSPEGGVLDGVLGMNFFWNRNVIFEPIIFDPNLGSHGFFHVSAPIAVPFGDFDVDFDVDEDDARAFGSCLSGPAPGGLSPECDLFDADNNLRIDLRDLAYFYRCYSASDVQADPACGP